MQPAASHVLVGLARSHAMNPLTNRVEAPDQTFRYSTNYGNNTYM